MISPIEFANIQPGQVLNYLEEKGWHEVKSPREGFTTWEFEQNGTQPYRFFQVYFPIDGKKYGDYWRVMRDVVERLAEFEQCPVNELYYDLLYPGGVDIIRLRVHTDDTQSGMISLPDGVHLAEAGLKLLRAAVLDKLQAPAAGRDDENVKRTLKQCRMAPAEKGSYVAVFFCPVGNLNEQNQLVNTYDESLIRSATTRLMKTLGRLNNFLQYQDELAEGKYGEAIIEPGQAYEVLARWSRFTPQSDPDVPTSVKVEQFHINQLRKQRTKRPHSQKAPVREGTIHKVERPHQKPEYGKLTLMTSDSRQEQFEVERSVLSDAFKAGADGRTVRIHVEPASGIVYKIEYLDAVLPFEE